MRAFVLIVALLATFSPIASALAADDGIGEGEAIELLIAANERYEAGLVLAAGGDRVLAEAAFREAAEGFEELVASGYETGEVLFNLGNARLRGGDLSGAIAAYLQAEALLPADERIERNLRAARSRVATAIDGAEAGVRDGGPAVLRPVVWLHELLPGRLKVWLFVAFAAVFWALLLVRLADRRFVARRVAVLPFVVALVTSASVAADVLIEPASVAVVGEDGTTARSGPGEAYERSFTERLAEGVELRVAGERGGWLRGVLADGRVAWVRAGDVVVVGR